MGTVFTGSSVLNCLLSRHFQLRGWHLLYLSLPEEKHIKVVNDFLGGSQNSFLHRHSTDNPSPIQRQSRNRGALEISRR